MVTIPMIGVFNLLRRSQCLPSHHSLGQSFPKSDQNSLTDHLTFLFVGRIIRRYARNVSLRATTLRHIGLPRMQTSLASPTACTITRTFNTPVVLRTSRHSNSLQRTTTGRRVPALLCRTNRTLQFSRSTVHVNIRNVCHIVSCLKVCAPPNVISPSDDLRSHRAH